jgi:hypothetical protein
VAWTSAGISLAGAGAILVLARSGRVVEGQTALYAMAAALTVAAFAAFVAVRFLRLAIFAAVQAASTVVIVLIFVLLVWPGLEASESTKTVVRRLAAGGLADQLAGAYRVPDVSLDFYLGRALARETDPLALARRVASDPGRLWIVRSDEVDAMISRLPLGVERVLTVSRHAVVRLSPGINGGGREGGS